MLVIVLDGVLRRLTAPSTTGGGFDEEYVPDVTVCSALTVCADIRQRGYVGRGSVVATGIARVRMSRRRKRSEGERAFISFIVTAEKGRLAERR